MEIDRFLATLAATPTVAAWSVHAIAARRLSVGTKDGETGNPHAPVSIADALALEWKIVFRDGKVSRGSADRSGIPTGGEEGLGEIERLATEDPDARDVAPQASMPEIALRDPSAARLVEGDLDPVRHWLEAVRARVGDGAARSWSGSLAASVATVRVATSSGLDARSETTHLSWHAVFDGEAVAGRASRSLEALDDLAPRLDRALAYRRALSEPSELRGGADRPVLLHPDVVESWVIPALLKNLSGRAVDRGESAFDAASFRERRPLLGERLTIALDPTRPLGSGSYRFTPEGIPARPVTLVDGGRLVSPILDLKHARRFGLLPTAVAHGTDTVALSGVPRLSAAEAMGDADGGLVALRVLGVHTLDAASGDFSLAAPQSLRIAGGRARGRVRATLVGNLFEALRDPRLRFVAFEGEPQPGILIRGRVDPAEP